jgi:hypothetical protein
MASAAPSERKQSAVDLAKLVDKAIRVKLAGGREGAAVFSATIMFVSIKLVSVCCAYAALDWGLW